MAKEVAEAAVEQVIDEVVAEGAEEVVAEFATKAFGLGLLIGSVSGLAVGYFVVRKRLETKYEQYAQDEINQMRDHYLKKEKASEPKPDLSDRVQALGYAGVKTPEVQAAGAVVLPHMPEDVVEEEAPAVNNVFPDTPDTWNFETEVVSRTAEEPYIIHKDEFHQGNFQGEEHERATLTYFAEDDVLIKEDDQRIPDIDEHVGLENLEKFGHGSGDPNVVYIRNHVMKVDFEVLRSQGSYSAEVLGVEEEPDELEHSAMRRHRSRRNDDDEE